MIETIRIKSQLLETDIKVAIIGSDYPCIFKGLIILLHGKTEHEEDTCSINNMISGLSLEELARKHQLLIVVPHIMKNCYYISTKEFNCEEFISKELICYIEQKYPSLKNKEKILAGISMGGYGSVLIGANTNVFDKIVSISGSFISRDIIIGNQEVWGNRKPNTESARGTFLSYFLPLSDFEESVNNIEIAIAKAKKVLSFYFTCGINDWLYSRNLRFLRFMEETKHIYKFFPLDGEHNNKCFKEGLWMVIDNIFEKKE